MNNVLKKLIFFPMLAFELSLWVIVITLAVVGLTATSNKIEMFIFNKLPNRSWYTTRDNKMTNSEGISKCCTCGCTWTIGLSGAHSCSMELLGRIKRIQETWKIINTTAETNDADNKVIIDKQQYELINKLINNDLV